MANPSAMLSLLGVQGSECVTPEVACSREAAPLHACCHFALLYVGLCVRVHMHVYMPTVHVLYITVCVCLVSLDLHKHMPMCV